MQGNPQQQDKGPRLSVVMPVHNALPYLDAAIESILGQTFGDFEFVIFDDGSTDGSTERLREWAAKDSRIRLIHAERNLGPAVSSQRVAEAAAAPIVARMDADDISHPDRLELQLRVLDEHPEVGVVGGLLEVIDCTGRKIRDPDLSRLHRDSPDPPFGNGPMTYRRSVFEAVGGYRSQCEFWEDQDLLIRMAAVSKIMVVPRAIYQVRQSVTSTRFVWSDARLERALGVMYACLDRVRAGQSYEDILARPVDPDAKIDPRCLISLGSVILWAGKRPRLFRRLLERGSLSPNFSSLSAVVWTAWASLSPGSLRAFLLLLARLRNRRAKRRIHSLEPVAWPAEGREGTQSQPPPVDAEGGRPSAISTKTQSARN